MPNVDAANIAYNMVKVLAHGITIGPILLGAAQPAQIVTSAITARNLLNVSAISSVVAQLENKK
jgi:malate dehydrogenase (oxaloacetate-decarboxylating)(NADP+)